MNDPENGGSPITSYFLEWDAGSNGLNWEPLVGFSPASTALSYEVTGGMPGLTAGMEYRFRVTARNIHGWGTPSAEAIMIPASAPAIVPSV